MKSKNYDLGFYDNVAASASTSADEIVPLVIELIGPSSVVDVGCGSGSWLRSFNKHGVERILGIDGFWVADDQLVIPLAQFRRQDLSHSIDVQERFDLAVSLEVAEHLPQESADQFVTNLTELAPVVLFSAAIPKQGGTYHLNEQWAEYWIKKFGERDFESFDLIRHRVWQSPKVAVHYVQNSLIYVKRGTPIHLKLKTEFGEIATASAHSVVHPSVYNIRADPRGYTAQDVFGVWLPQFIRNKIHGLAKRVGIVSS